jgi:hypothetical protein
MAPHAGAQHLGDHSATVPFSAQHLPEAHGRSAAQDAADVAGVLHAVEHDGAQPG